MSTSVRSNILFAFAAITFFAIQWFSNNYKDLDLPIWLQFIKTTYGSLAVSLVSSTTFLIFIFYNYREVRAIEGMSRRSKNIHKWIFYVAAGIIVLGIPLEIAIFISKLHASG